MATKLPKLLQGKYLAAVVLIALSYWAIVRLLSWLGPDEVSVHRSEVYGEDGVLSFRMNEPFTLAIAHRQQEREPTVNEGSYARFESIEPNYEALIARFPSRYDWLRGGYIATVRFQIDNGTAVLESAGQTVRVTPLDLSPNSGRTVNWANHSGSTIGKYLAVPLGDFKTPAHLEERLWVYPQPDSDDYKYPGG